MMKLGRYCLSRHRSSETLLPGKGSGFRDALWSDVLAFQAGISTDAQQLAGTGSSASRVFASYTIYKGKAALSVHPILPTFNKLDSGDFRLDRKGSMMFTFWPAVGERKYNWEKRQHFSFSPTEVGSLLSMSQRDSAEFFHDPAMKSSNSGQVRKSFSIKAHDDGSGFFISLTVQNNILRTTERFSVPVTAAEFAVLKTACGFALPHIMGWDRLTGESLRGADASSSKVSRPLDLDLEWEK